MCYKELNHTSASKLRKIVGYEKDVVRCENCISYHGDTIAMKNSKYKRVPAMCRKHNFSVLPAACCDMWNGRDGSIIDS